MSDLGLMLAWSAVQVSLVLAAAAALHALARRRSPASGAWVASLGLGLTVVVGLVSMALQALAPVPGPAEAAAVGRTTITPAERSAAAGRMPEPVGTAADDQPRLTLATLRVLLGRLDRTLAEPAARCRPWGTLMALACLTGAGGGLLRLVIGLWAVRLVRLRGRPVDDPELARLLADLRSSMACPRRVEVRETPDLTAPATAGWRRPVILLPQDWRSWQGDELRAVVAHEMAHIRGDHYLAGVVSQAALALYFYHPLVHWLAACLRLEQELDADALGSRFAGGKALYLQSLSRLALRQEGRPPCWPARAFLPVKGTLIRRIAMLRAESKATDRPWSAPRRALAASLLLAIAGWAALQQGPVRANDRGVPAARGSDHSLGGLRIAGTERKPAEPFDLSYVTDDDSQGFIAVRPAAAFRRAGMGHYRILLNLWIGQQWSELAKALNFDPAQPGRTPPRIEMIEEVTTGFRAWRTGGKKPDGRVGLGDVWTVRTTEPVDWVALLRALKQDPIEAREGDRVYYTVKNPALGPENGAFFCPDDRTLVFAGETRLLKLLRRPTSPPTPVFARGKDWDRLARGLLLVALDNRGGRLTKALGNAEPEDEDFDPRPVFHRTDLWAVGLDDDDAIVLRGVGTCPDNDASEATVRAIRSLFDRALKELDQPGPQTRPRRADEAKANRMAQDFFKRTRAECEGHSVLVRAAGLGTLADFASLVAAGVID